MNIFICKNESCGNKCKIAHNSLYPVYCPYFPNREAEFVCVKQDAKDDTPKLPKLTDPEWCKVGNLVYDEMAKEYATITSIKPLAIKYLNKDVQELSSDYRLSEARLRPWTFEELPKIPFVVRFIGNENNFATTAVSCSKKGVWLGGASMAISFDGLLKDVEQIDGSPCGVLEHKLNGEYVK